MINSQDFNYDTAFLRNLGFISKEEQQKLKESRVAIAGLGGTGGAQVAALSRLGIGQFSIADLDEYELKNFNRQYGATMQTIDQKKTEVAENIILSINPEANISRFDNGIQPDNIDQFLDGVDIVVDSLDFYCFKERFMLYSAAREKGLWVITSPPLGFGFTLFCFNPEGMTFEAYFNFKPGDDDFNLSISLLAGIMPVPYLLKYLNKSDISIGNHQLPSVSAAPFIIAGITTTEVVNILFHRPSRIEVPTVIQCDAMLHKFRKHKFRWGMCSPLQKLKRAVLKLKLSKDLAGSS